MSAEQDEKINTALLTEESLESGVWVLIHVGFALALIDEAEAKTTPALLSEMENVYAQELQALSKLEISDTGIRGFVVKYIDAYRERPKVIALSQR